MKVTLYKNLSDENTINPELTEPIELEYTILEPCSMGAPSIRVKTEADLSLYNYMTIPEFNRSYSIAPPTKYRNGVYVISATEADDLNNWWSWYKSEPALIGRQEFVYNWNLPDEQLQESEETFTSVKLVGDEFSYRGVYSFIQGTYETPTATTTAEEGEVVEGGK